MEAQLVSEFVSRTGANTNDALSCLNSWGWDLKKALIDYNDTSTTNYFNGRAKTASTNTPPSSSSSNVIASGGEHNKISIDTTDSILDNPTVYKLRRPSLIKSDSIDVVDYKKLYRGISRATDDNVNLVSRARTEIAMDFHTNCFKQPENIEHVDSPDFTFTLPDISIYADDFRKFLEKDLVECSTLSSLESSQRLNWWADYGYCRKLWPLATSGDGNCLLHAASLAMWGFHDRKLTLRTALYNVLSKGEYRDSIWRRWRFQQTRINKEAGFVYCDLEWKREWGDIVSLSSPEPRNQQHSSANGGGSGNGTNFATSTSAGKGLSRRRSVAMDRNFDSIDDNATYESLEEIHIFALAHVLRRTIIVVSDTVLRDMNGEAMAPIPFGGVYLPFEIPAEDCHRAPLLLTYDMAHFSALVSMEIDGDVNNEQPPPSLIPLVDIDNVLLQIQFCIDPGEDFDWNNYDGSEGNWALSDREHIALLKEYLDVVYTAPLGSPDEEIWDDLTDEEYERRLGESDVALSVDEIGGGGGGGVGSGTGPNGNKSKAAKQLSSVAKQFGSIGKSMSKKIKKNIGSITKIGGGGGGTNGGGIGYKSSLKKGSLSSSGTSTQSFTRQRILCAKLKAKRYEYQEEMIRNYLQCAQDRFLDAEKSKALRLGDSYDMDKMKSRYTIYEEQKTCCINAGCQNFGTSQTSYMCNECFEKQKEQELIMHDVQQAPPRYGTGNSKFYTQSDMLSHQNINRLPSARRLNELDQTLYLSNSTFYNDKRTVPESHHNHSQHHQQQHQQNPCQEQLQHNSSSSSSSINQQQQLNGSSFRHGYSPTTRQSMGPPPPPLIDYDMPDSIDSDIFRNVPSSRYSINSASAAAVAAATITPNPPQPPPPPGTASVFSPGKTIIHHIVRQTVNLPPSDDLTSYNSSIHHQNDSDPSQTSRNNHYSSTTVDIHRGSLSNGSGTGSSGGSGGIATPFSQSQAQPCRTAGCKFFGSNNTNFYCSKCCQLQQQRQQQRSSNVVSSTNQQARSQSKVLTDV